MKVLLVEDIEKLGWLGDIVDVKDGYARNYLLPQGLAQTATEDNVKAIAEEKEKRAHERMAEREKLEKLCEEVNGAEAVIAEKANEQGHLFGSVTEKAIAENLQSQGFKVADKNVKMTEHIKEVGTYEITLRLAEDLKAKINLTVVAENAELETEQTQVQAAIETDGADENSGTDSKDE